MLTQSCGVFQVTMLSVCVISLEMKPIIMLLAHLILSLLNSSFLCLCFLVTHTCLSHTLVIGNLLVVPSVFRGCFLLFFPLLNSFSSLHFAALVIYSYSISSLSLSLPLWAFTFQAGIDFCQCCSNMTVLRQ